MKRICLPILAVFVMGAGLWFIKYMNHSEVTPSPPSAANTPTASSSAATGTSVISNSAVSESVISSASVEENLLPDDLSSILDTSSQTVPLDTIPGSITALVNRDYLLPSTYTPSDLVEVNIRFSFSYSHDKRKLRRPAAEALEKMFKAAEKEMIILYGVSGYRSYARQKQIYDQNVAARGKSATDTVSARPGSSEHQTGLAIDISAKSVGCQLSQAFGDTKEGKWVAKYAHKYGYIIRYPNGNGKSKITGYHYEPWHIRYVGVDVATYLYKNELTLEEYYNVSFDENEDETGMDVEDPDDINYATQKPKKNHN